jgi:Tol biopolymer transport system component
VTSRLTFQASNVNDPVWAPDSRTVAYFASDKGVPDFYRQTLGSREAVSIFESPDVKYPHDWSSDGLFLLFHLARRLMLVSVADGKVRELLSAPGSVDSGRFSPDGRAVAYGSNQSGVWEIFLASLPDFKDNRQISSQGGGQPRWRDDGRELFYLDHAGKVMSVTVTTTMTSSGREITTSAPTALFTSPLAGPNPLIDEYDVTRDGQRFVFIRPRAGATLAPLIVRVNWTAALK